MGLPLTMTSRPAPLAHRPIDRRYHGPYRDSAQRLASIRPRPVAREHDPRTATWEISRSFDCTVEAIAPRNFCCDFVPFRMRASHGGQIVLADAQILIAPRPRPVAIVVRDGALVLRGGDGPLDLDRRRCAALIPAGVAIDVSAAGAMARVLLIEFEPEAFLHASAPLVERPDAALIREAIGGGRILPGTPAEDDRARADCVGQLVDLAAADTRSLFPELEACLMRALCLGVFGARPGLNLPAPADQPMDPRLRTLCAAVLDSLSGEVGLATMARASGLSARTIQLLFKRHFDMSPKQWILEQRLLAVHARLCRPGACDSVTSIAIPYFGNLGEFARRYRRRFGEKPSATLARARGGA